MPERIGLNKHSKKIERLLELLFGGKMPYHIHPETGDIKSCKAKTRCPFGDIESQHYSSFEEGRAIFEQQEEFFQNARGLNIQTNELTNQALTADLHKNYKTPKWLKQLAKEYKNKNFLTEDPRIIDQFILDGKKFDVVFYKNNLSEADATVQEERGYDVSAIEYRDSKTGERIGYLKAIYETNESLERAFGNDQWAIFRNIESSEMGRELMNRTFDKNGEREMQPHFDETMTEEEQIEGKKRFIKNTIRYLDHKYLGKDRNKIYDFTTNKMNHQELDDKLKEVQEITKRVIERKSQYYLNKPFIDFSRIEENYRGKGLGEGLYVYAGRMLGEKGMTLRGSGLQTPEAKKVWLRMAANDELPIKMTNMVHYNADRKVIETAPMLDFRK